jgi:uncharacterized protein (DUF1800 family)
MASTLRPYDQLDPVAEWTAWKPDTANPWSAKWAAHLYRRAAFGATREELRQATADGMHATVEKLFALPKDAPPRETVVTGEPPLSPTTGMPDPSKQIAELRAAWLQRMLQGGEPAREKLALFWHNHFATSIKKVNDAALMERQGELLFRHAHGSFRTLLKEISRDPAMLIFLDSNQNVKAHPNENYAREVMELFTLGVGHYTEKDIQEAARAFTGWHTADGKFRFVASQHDDGTKQVLKQRGNWDGDAVLRILLEQPACAMFIVRKLYREFVNENQNPPDAFLAPVAEAFRKSDYNISVPVKMMVQSRHFYSAYAYRQKIKSPIEYALGMARMIGVGITGRVVLSPYSLLGALELMGQLMYAPPNVKGWEGGKSWLNTATVLAHHNFAHALVNGGSELNDYAKKFAPRAFYPAVTPLAYAARQGITDGKKLIDFYANALLPDDFRPEVRSKLVEYMGDLDPDTEQYQQRCRDVLFVMLTLPEYQLN